MKKMNYSLKYSQSSVNLEKRFPLEYKKSSSILSHVVMSLWCNPLIDMNFMIDRLVRWGGSVDLSKTETKRKNKSLRSECLDVYSGSCNYFVSAITSNSRTLSDNKEIKMEAGNQQLSTFWIWQPLKSEGCSK